MNRALINLAAANLRVHRIRASLTIAAIALSVCLVVAITGGYASLSAAAHRMLVLYLGTTDVEITRRDDLHGGISYSLIQQIRADAAVERADPRLEFQSHPINSAGITIAGHANVIGIERPQDTRVETLRLEQGKWFDRSDSNEAVVDQVLLDRLGAKLGDSFILPLLDRQLTLRIVGVVHKPRILAAAIQTVYVPLYTLQSFVNPDNSRSLSGIMIDLVTGADADAFATRWKAKLAAIDPKLNLKLAGEKRKAMEDNLQGLRALSYLGGTVSMVAAAFIVFSALSMGVTERQRTLAMLRAIGAYRSQLGQLVVCEGMILSSIGIIVGIPLGIACVHILVLKFTTLFNAGAVLSIGGIIFASIGALATALAASLLPASSAMRASPLEAMSPLARPSRTINIVYSAIAGLLLLTVDELILYGPLPRSVQFYAHFTIGLASIMLGFFLIAPAIIKIVEALLSPIVAAMFGLRLALFRQQFSSGVWRVAGTCAALMVGLASLVVGQVQGTSAIQGWSLPTKFPDMFISSFIGLNQADQEKLKKVPGIDPDQLMPIAIASPQFGSNFFALAGAAFMPDATMFFGIDPDKAMEMMELDFRDGNAKDARRLLKQGKHIIVTQEYRQLRGLGVGDKLPLKTSKGVVDFTIAGVVWSPGIDLFASLYDLGRQFDQRTAASVFGTLDDAREYFGVEEMHLFAANVRPGLDRDKFILAIQYNVGRIGLDASDVRQLKSVIQQTFLRMLLLSSSIAFAAMGIASLGVTNTIMASIRTRRWHFGVLRSIGVTRSQLLRLVMAEAVLIGIVAIGLGLAAGFQLTMDARQGWSIFIGIKPPMVIPWSTIKVGVSVVMAIALGASLWPAIHVARTEPLTLLQAGRAAT